MKGTIIGAATAEGIAIAILGIGAEKLTFDEDERNCLESAQTLVDLVVQH